MPEKIKGKDITLSVNDMPVGCARTSTIEMTTSTLDATSKCSKDPDSGIMYQEMQPNIISGTMTIDGLQPVITSGGTPDEYSAKELASMQFNQTYVDALWTDEAGLFGFASKAFVTSLRVEGAYDGIVSYTATLQLTGVISPVPLT